MSREFHVFVNTEHNHQQSFIFEVDRSDDNSITFDDLYLVTNTIHGEIKTRIKFHELIQSVLQQQGGNLMKEGVVKIVELLHDIIPQEKQTEIMDDINHSDACEINAETLIKLSEEILIESPLCQSPK